jgi:hypothetical protein
MCGGVQGKRVSGLFWAELRMGS